MYGVPDSLLEIHLGTLRDLPPFTDSARRRRLHDDLKPFTRMAKNDPDTEMYAYAGVQEVRDAERLDLVLAILDTALDEIEQAASGAGL
jgi:hypothetical protein